MNRIFQVLFTGIVFLLLSAAPSQALSRFWVGCGGSLDGSSTTHISATSGGSGGASYPTSSDTLTFDSASCASAYAVATSGTLNVLDLTMAGPASGNLTWSGSSPVNIFGSVSIAATGITRTYSGTITFSATSSKTIDINQTMGGPFVLSGAGGSWQLLNNLNIGTSNLTYSASGGSLDTNGKTLTASSIIGSTNTKTWTLGSSTFTLSGTQFSLNSGDTFNANTSTINITVAGSLTFAGSGKTFNVLSIATGSNTTITGTNTFASLTLTNSGSSGPNYILGANQVISGLLTITGGNSSTQRLFLSSDTKGTQRTITAGSISMSNVDLQDVSAGGASSPWNLSAITGLSGDCGNNSNITFTSPRTLYFEHGASASYNFSDVSRWFTATNGGGSSVTTPPLPQDTALFNSDSFATSGRTVVQDMTRLSAVDFTGGGSSHATNSPTFTTSTAASIYGSMTLLGTGSMVLTASTQTYTIENRSGTIYLYSSGQSWAKNWIVNNISGTFSLGDAFVSTAAFTVTSGNFTDNSNDFTTGIFSSSNSNTRQITKINAWYITGNATTIYTTATSTGLTFNRGSLPIYFNYSGPTGTRTILSGSLGEASAPDLSVTAGSDIVAVGTNNQIHNLDFTGFTGSFSNNAKTIFGNLTLGSSPFTMTDGSNTTTFGATSGTQVITSNGITFGGPITQSGAGGTVQFADNFIMPSSRAYTHSHGTLDINAKTASFGTYLCSFVNTRSLISTGASGTIEITTASSGTAFSTAVTTGLTVGSGINIIFRANTSNVRVFTGGGLAFGSLTFVNTSVGGLDFVGSNSFTDFIYTGSVSQTFRFTASSTNTFADWHVNGTASNLVTLNSTTTTDANLVYSGGSRVSADYLNIQNIDATPGTLTWYAGANSVDNQSSSGGTGWVFTVPPSLTLIKSFMGLIESSTKSAIGTTRANVKGWVGVE